MAKKRRQKTISALSNDVAALIQKLVRVKAADRDGYCRCVTCGKVGHYTEMQGGHFISRAWLATRLMEENIHVQCAGCNGPGQGNLIAYTMYMEDTYGKPFVLELLRRKHSPTKYRRPDLEDLKDEYRGRIAEIMAEKG
ncbi:MAG: recombination protein NinG, partial [Patescibacteria group bacterium]|nr:recombination protein NinG [Patescibacteria group bacterium]